VKSSSRKPTASRSAKRHTPSRTARTNRSASARSPRKKTSRTGAARSSKAAVTRSRATTPARSTHTSVLGTHAPARRSEPIPSPLPMRHVAPPRAVLVTPARSMPPSRDQRKLAPVPPRGALVVPDFTEAGVLLAITYSIREGRRGEFFDLMRELKPLLSGIGGMDCTIYEDRSRPHYFMEVFRFKDEAEFTAFDDKFHKDRKIAAIYALLDDIVEAEKSDFKIFERRL
jgi:hypothetical protein